MKKLLMFYLAVLLLALIIIQFALANPIPVGVPYVLMTHEDIRVFVNDDLTANVMGIYTFKVIYAEPSSFSGYISGEGTIRYIGIEAGFYGIVGDNGEHYDPINLHSDFKKDGLRVKYVLRPRPDLMNFHMWGTIVEILSISTPDGDSLSWKYTFCFPAPPDAKQISVAKKGQALDWYWSQEKYLTTVSDLVANAPPELQEWPMFAWNITLEPDTLKLTIQYKHKLIKVNDDWVLLYSLGTGRYVGGWNPPIPGMPSGKPFVDVEINVTYPAGLRPLACSPKDNYNPTISFYPIVSWKASSIEAKNDFIVLFGEEAAFDSIGYDFNQAGWYLISLPVKPSDNSIRNLFPTANSAFAWKDDQYVSVKTIEPKKGYWLAIPSPYSGTMKGLPVKSFSEHYKVGWHLIGSVIDSVDFTNPNDQPDGSVLTPAFGYDIDSGTYFPADTLVPGQGYWIAVIRECDLTISETSSSMAKPIARVDREAFYRQLGSQPPPSPAINRTAGAVTRVPERMTLLQNYPNPFNPETTIKYQLPENKHVTLEIYDVLGRLVRTLINLEQTAGYHEVLWDARDDQAQSVASGLYFYRIQAGELQAMKKLLLVK